MSLFSIFKVASSGMTAQSQRLNTVASNLANADSATGPDGHAYRARHVVFAAQPLDGVGVAGMHGLSGLRRGASTMDTQAMGVQVTAVIDDPSAPRMV